MVATNYPIILSLSKGPHPLFASFIEAPSNSPDWFDRANSGFCTDLAKRLIGRPVEPGKHHDQDRPLTRLVRPELASAAFAIAS